MARSTKSSSSSSPPRRSARLALTKKGQTKKQQKKQQQQRGKLTARARTRATTRNENNRFDKQQLEQLGPNSAPAGMRWICPYHVQRPNSNICRAIFGGRNDLVRHVTHAHFNGTSGWGSNIAHFQDCGPYSQDGLRRRGVTTRLTARRKVEEAAELANPASTLNSEDDSDEDYLSDGDSGPDQGPPKGRKDDGNDGNDHGYGHGLAQQIAVA